MTLADLWKYIKGDSVTLIETNGVKVAKYENHKYMARTVDRIASINNETFVYLV